MRSVADLDGFGVALGRDRFGREQRLHELRVAQRDLLRLRAGDERRRLDLEPQRLGDRRERSACSYTRFWNWSAAAANFCADLLPLQIRLDLRLHFVERPRLVGRDADEPDDVPAEFASGTGPTISPGFIANTASSNAFTIVPRGLLPRSPPCGAEPGSFERCFASSPNFAGLAFACAAISSAVFFAAARSASLASGLTAIRMCAACRCSSCAVLLAALSYCALTSSRRHGDLRRAAHPASARRTRTSLPRASGTPPRCAS